MEQSPALVPQSSTITANFGMAEEDRVVEPPQIDRAYTFAEQHQEAESINGLRSPSQMPISLGQREDNESISDLEEHPARKQRTCYNQLCGSTNLYKRIKSRVEPQKYRTLCEPCHTNYSNGQFCEFCQQIYDDSVNDDDHLKWMGCDSCDKWNHVACQMKYRLKNADVIKQQNAPYECGSCANKQKKKQEPTKKVKPPPVEQNPYEYKGSFNTKRKTARQTCNEERDQEYQNRSEQYVNVFNFQRQSFFSLESLLQTYNCRLSINDEEIRDDLQKFRNLASVESSQTQMEEEEDEDRKSRKKIRK